MSRQALGLLLGFVGIVVFGGTLPFTRLAVAGLDPWFVSLGRAALAGLLAVPVLLIASRRRPRAGEWRDLLLSTIGIVGLFPILTAVALQSVDASHGGVVLGILPLATAAVATILTGERPGGAFWTAALAGAALVVAFSMRGGGGSLTAGDALLLAAVASSALGYALSGRLTQQGYRGWEVISWQLVIALPVTLPVSVWLAPSVPSSVPPSAWIGFAYVALMSQYLGFFAWNAGLALGGIARVSQVQLLQTFVTLAIAALINAERVDGWTWAVAVVVVLLVVAGGRARIRRSAA